MTTPRPNRPVAGSGIKGSPPTEVWDVLDRAWAEPFSVSSNFAREQAQAVAIASSLGWITCLTLDGTEFTRRWCITAAGAVAIQSKDKLC